VQRVIAETLPELTPSIGVLRKCGFRPVGEGSEPGVIRFELTRADYSAQTFKHILAPVWMLSYVYGRKSYQCAMNGVTGAIAGEYPKSAWKIALIVLGLVILMVIVFSAGGGR